MFTLEGIQACLPAADEGHLTYGELPARKAEWSGGLTQQANLFPDL